MKASWWLVVLCSLSTVAIAGDDKSKSTKESSDSDARILSAAEVQKYMAPYADSVGDCYKKHGLNQKTSSGDVRIGLIIHRDGSVFRVRTRARGVKGKALGECIEKLSKKWSFPPRRGFTHAVVPFYYLKTQSKGAGPMESCWSAKGCPKKRHHRRVKRRETKSEKGGK